MSVSLQVTTVPCPTICISLPSFQITSLALTIDSYCNYAVMALVVYEYIFTCGQEVELFWGGRITPAFVLFISNRYFYVFYAIINAGISHVEEVDCTLAQRAFFGLDTIPYSIWAYFSGLRAYALTTNWAIGLVVFAFSMVAVGANLSYLFKKAVAGVVVPGIGCVAQASVTHSMIIISTKSYRVTTTSRISMMAADILLIFLTWSRLRQSSEIGTLAAQKGSSFASVLTCDGIIYFLTIMSMNALHLGLTLFSLSHIALEASRYIVFTEPLTAILVSRFLLDLQAIKRRREDGSMPELKSDLYSYRAQRTLVFEHVVDSLVRHLRLNLDILPAAVDGRGKINDM
ncbi:hypothetical protein OH76DRAFT_1555093 [Lentinus brumalis]|uniref:DUF6533 domain-containing protein n=1 Tax=Lentinus brumalis TaxID=2498619 RepID=A0A371DFT1_9APHY|nr:hypothetical protein OH76DRAFT_1555093 [Polyporus brumalis]